MGNWDAWLLEGFPRAPDDPMRRFVEQGEWWASKVSDKDRAFVRTFVPQVELAARPTDQLRVAATFQLSPDRGADQAPVTGDVEGRVQRQVVAEVTHHGHRSMRTSLPASCRYSPALVLAFSSAATFARTSARCTAKNSSSVITS